MYRLSQQQVLDLAKQSKKASKFFEKLYPGSTLQTFKTGDVYEHDEYGKFILGHITDNSIPVTSAVLIGLESGAAFVDSVPLDTKLHPQKAANPIILYKKEVERVFGGDSSFEHWSKQTTYKISDGKVAELISKSKHAQDFFRTSFPGSTLKRFYTGTTYEHPKFGPALLSIVGDGAYALIELNSGNRLANFKQIKTDGNRDVIELVDGQPEATKTWLDRKEAKALFGGNFDGWVKISE